YSSSASLGASRIKSDRNSSRSTALFGRNLYGNEEPALIESAALLLGLGASQVEALRADRAGRCVLVFEKHLADEADLFDGLHEADSAVRRRLVRRFGENLVLLRVELDAFVFGLLRALALGDRLDRLTERQRASVLPVAR